MHISKHFNLFAIYEWIAVTTDQKHSSFIVQSTVYLPHSPLPIPWLCYGQVKDIREFEQFVRQFDALGSVAALCHAQTVPHFLTASLIVSCSSGSSNRI